MLAPLSAIYGRAVLARRRHIEARPAARFRLVRPVVSVGNLAVGGSGKTPFTRWLARRLVAGGHRPSILSRGYRRSLPDQDVVVVSDGTAVLADLSRAGDEPLMLARSVPGAAVVVCPDRYRAGLMAENRLSCTMHLLDDGFQHLRLDRDVDLLLLDEQDVTDRVLPAGRLREPLEAARSAHAVLWTGTLRAPDVRSMLEVETVFELRRTPGSISGLEPADGELPPGAPVVALAGVARPERFFRELEESGLDVRARLPYRDHHPYSAGDVARVLESVEGTGAHAVVTTEKDLVRLMPLAPLPFRLAWRRLDVLPADPEGFFGWLDARLAASGDRGPLGVAGAPIA